MASSLSQSQVSTDPGAKKNLDNVYESQNEAHKQKKVMGEEALLTVVLAITTSLYTNRNTVPERVFDHAMSMGKKLIRYSVERPLVKTALGVNPLNWKEYVALFEIAIPALEAQSFISDDPLAVNANGSCSTWMALNHVHLMKDLERLDDLLVLARNILTAHKCAQDFAGETGLDKQVFKLIGLCIRVTAQGYDGDPASRNETIWANIVQLYKKLLITCLQFLVNLIQQNDNRKFLLWLDLFGSSRSADDNIMGNLEPHRVPNTLADGEDVLDKTNGNGKQQAEEVASDEVKHFTSPVSSPADQEGNNSNLEQDGSQGSKNEPVDPSTDSPMIQLRPGNLLEADLSPQESARRHVNFTFTTPEPPFQNDLSTTQNNLDEVAVIGDGVTASKRVAKEKNDQVHALRSELRTRSTRFDDIPIIRPPESAGNHLQQAKDQLMARIEDNHDGQDSGEHDEFASSENADDGDIRGSDVAANGSARGDEDDDEQPELRTPGDQQRGLLTDIPLILGPPEIEALPMILQAGIVDDRVRNSDEDGIQGIRDEPDMHAVRCNILLAQESGRNLLRELLIFIAAWDLQDDDLYFKLMMQIMGAILNNGLMPFAYQAFSEEKDIVSPAQSMVIKILTQIFRSKSARTTASPEASLFLDPRPQREVPTRVDILVVRNMFTKFRQCVIPETCALIYLQGKIRTNAVAADGFPLTMWDMERVYEGVYQFLEFFAVLTETEEWKGLLVQWEIVNELVTLLRELEINIPKAPLGPLPQTVADAEAAAAAAAAAATAQSGSATTHQSTPTPVAVERPYDQAPTDSAWQRNDYGDGGGSEAAEAPMDSQDPSEFEWRNLKKLVVLVLSSLVWRSPTVQDQIRQYGGVEMILACCTLDGHNPYIREHAIMCLRFLLEDNEKNIDIVRQLAPRTTVPDEVMDKRGYETYIDDKGKVGLRAKEGAPASALHADDELQASASASASAS